MCANGGGRERENGAHNNLDALMHVCFVCFLALHLIGWFCLGTTWTVWSVLYCSRLSWFCLKVIYVVLHTVRASHFPLKFQVWPNTTWTSAGSPCRQLGINGYMFEGCCQLFRLLFGSARALTGNLLARSEMKYWTEVGLWGCYSKMYMPSNIFHRCTLAHSNWWSSQKGCLHWFQLSFLA